MLGTNLPCPPCNIGPISTSNYVRLANAAIHSFSTKGFTGEVFAGQRAEGFYVDLGAVFDLGILRPLAPAHATFGFPMLHNMPGVNSTDKVNVHSLALRVPIAQLTADRMVPTSVTDPKAILGVWTSASRQKVHIAEDTAEGTWSGPFVQVSRLGNPLVNEVIIALANKDRWNKLPPKDDNRFLPRFTNPELAQLLPVLYPGAFPNLSAYNAGTPNRADLVAILLTGIPNGVVPKITFSTFPGTGVQADELRLNVAIPPTPTASVSNLGLLGNDIGGFPNGRRVFDDVATIELRAIAGSDAPSRRPQLHRGRGHRRRHLWLDIQWERHHRERHGALPFVVPVSRASALRLFHPLTCAHPPRIRPVRTRPLTKGAARVPASPGPWCSISAVRSGRPWCMSTPTSTAPRSRSVGPEALGTAPTRRFDLGAWRRERRMPASSSPSPPAGTSCAAGVETRPASWSRSRSMAVP